MISRFFIDRPIFAAVISIFLVLAGLAAHGDTTIYEIHHIERGYAGFVPSLVGLGARIEHLDQPSPFDD